VTLIFGLIEVFSLFVIFFAPPGHPALLTTAFILYGFGLNGLVTTLGGLFPTDIAPKKVAGAVMGFVGVFSYLAAATQDWVSGYLIEQGTTMVDGGGFNYGAVAAAKTGLKVAAVTRLAREDFRVVRALESDGIDVFPTATPSSTHMRLEYPTANVDERVLSVARHAGAYTTEQFDGLDARAFLINASTRDEVPLEVIAHFRERAPLLSAGEGAPPLRRRAGLRPGDRPGRDPRLRELARAGRGPLHDRRLEGRYEGGRAGHGRERPGDPGPGDRRPWTEGDRPHPPGWRPRAREREVPQRPLPSEGAGGAQRFHPKELVGRSGRGDTCIGSYLAKRQSASPAEATVWAAALTSLKMEAEGPFKGQAADVEELIAKQYR